MRLQGSIATPLNKMLWKGEFRWSEESKAAYENLKKALMSPPILAMLNFDEKFLLECDASRMGIGVVLMQGGHLLAYIIQGLMGKALNLSTYEKEMLAILFTVQKWRQYLLGRRFIFKQSKEV